MHTILREIFKNTDLTPQDLAVISEKLTKITLQKGELLLQAGEPVADIFYIHEGCLRAFFTDDEDKEHTLQFAVKGWWISDYIALFGSTNNRAVSYIECIKPAILYRVSKADFDDLCRALPAVSQFHIKKLESAFAAFHRRILGNLTLSAKDRYLQFVKIYPDIEQNVKNYHIASFLGITTESLSRIRREIAEG